MYGETGDPDLPTQWSSRSSSRSPSRETATGVQVEDQDFEGQNLALVKSEAEGLPVRIVRGANGEPAFSPTSGYRYDGLFRVEESWRERGRSGLFVCRYRLVRLAEDGTPVPIPETVPQGPAREKKRPSTA